MSGKHSLLGQSLVRNANALNFGSDSNQQKHWSREWYTPLKPSTTSLSTTITPSSTPTPFGDDSSSITDSQPKYTFSVKTWVLVDEYKPVVDGEEDDILDLDQYSTIKVKESGSNGLSDDAIRGAVATGGDAIPGLSKSTDAAATAKEEKQREETQKFETTVDAGTNDETPKIDSDITAVTEVTEAPKTAETPEVTTEPIGTTDTAPVEEIITDAKNDETVQASDQVPPEPEAPAPVVEEQPAIDHAESEVKDKDGDVVVE